MTNLFKKLAAFALLITLSGTQITHTRSYDSDYDYDTRHRGGLIGNTFGFAGDTVKGAGNVVENTGDTLTGNRRQRRRQKREMQKLEQQKNQKMRAMQATE